MSSSLGPTAAFTALIFVFGSHLAALTVYSMLFLILLSIPIPPQLQHLPAMGLPGALALPFTIPVALLLFSLHQMTVAYRALKDQDYNRAFEAVAAAMVGELTLLPYLLRYLLGAGNRAFGYAFGLAVPVSLLAVAFYLRDMSIRERNRLIGA